MLGDALRGGRLRARHLPRQSLQHKKPQPGAQQLGRVRPFQGRGASPGARRGQHQRLLVRSRLVLDDPVARRRDERRRRMLDVLHEDAQGQRGSVPARHHRAVPDDGRAPKGREAHGAGTRDRKFLVSRNAHGRRRLYHGRGCVLVHRPRVFERRVPGDEQRRARRRSRGRSLAQRRCLGAQPAALRENREARSQDVLLVHLPHHHAGAAQDVHVAAPGFPSGASDPVAACSRHLR